MIRSIEDARRDLEALDWEDMPIAYRPQGVTADRPLRRSAVLMLFGALDRTPAAAEALAHTGAAVPPELDVLLTRRSPRMRHHPGQIAFPGGGVELEDADITATALREAAEETGLDPSGVDVLGELPAIHIPVSNNLVTPVVGWWRRPSEVAADRTESVEVFRAPVASLLDPAARGTSVLRSGSRTYRGEAFELPAELNGHLVWGFTGMLLSAVLDDLGWTVPWDRDRLIPVEP